MRTVKKEIPRQRQNPPSATAAENITLIQKVSSPSRIMTLLMKKNEYTVIHNNIIELNTMIQVMIVQLYEIISAKKQLETPHHAQVRINPNIGVGRKNSCH